MARGERSPPEETTNQQQNHGRRAGASVRIDGGTGRRLIQRIAHGYRMPAERNDDDLLTAKEVAAYLGIKDTQFGDARRAGEVPEPIRIGTTVRWRWGTLKEWAKAVQLARQVTPKIFKKSDLGNRRKSSESNDLPRNPPGEDLPSSGSKKGR